MRDFKQLPGDIRFVSRFMEAGTRRILQDVSRAIHESLVLATPVDTGRARSNWQVSTGAPINYSILPYAPGKGMWIDETANARAAIAQGRQATENIENVNEVFIVNNVLYVPSLNQGSSQQQAPMFVERSLDDGHAVAMQLKVFE